MHVGGNAAVLLEPTDEDSLLFALNELRANDAPYMVLGGGSNLIISDTGFAGAVVTTRKLTGVAEVNFSQISQIAQITEDMQKGKKCVQIPLEESAEICGISERYISVGAGAAWGTVLAACRERDWGGLEGFSGLSGTVGGAVFMNATCFGLSACDRLVSVRYYDAVTGEVRDYVLDDEKRKADWGYKKSPFQPTGALRETSPSKIILSAQFALSHGFDTEKAEDYLTQRKEKGHFRAPSAGSVFKNDAAHGVIAGKLIDECGLKGLQVGGARVADWHGNFIVNTGDATAQDVYDLTHLVQKIVREKTGVLLETEIIFAGAFFAH